MTKDETREHILKIAAALFAQKGFYDASMNDIVLASQISKGGIYWHFKSKDEIIEALFIQFFDMQIGFLQMMMAEDGTAKERLVHLAETLGTMINETSGETLNFPNPLDFYIQALRQEGLMQAVQFHADKYLDILASLIQEGIDTKEFEPCDAREIALILLSTIDGLVLASWGFLHTPSKNPTGNNVID